MKDIEILNLLIKSEKDAVDVYSEISKKISNPKISNIINKVIDEEKRHIGELAYLMNSLILKDKIEKDANIKIGDIKTFPSFLNFIQIDTKDVNFLVDAINKETSDIISYENFIEIVQDENIKKVLQDILKEEKLHLSEFIMLLRLTSDSDKISGGYLEAEELIDKESKCDCEIHRNSSIKFKFDPNSTENEGRYRIRDPKDFKKDTFRRWKQWAGIYAPKGVTFIVGELKDSSEKALQSIRFNKKYWDEKKAGEFIETLKDNEGFEKHWEWKKNACFLSFFSPFNKIAHAKNYDKISIIMLDDVPKDFDFSRFDGYLGINLFKFNDFELLKKNSDLINEFIKKAMEIKKDKFLGVFLTLNNVPLNKYAKLIYSNRYIIDITNPEFYTISTIYDMERYNATFWRKAVGFSASPGDIDYFDINIETKEDVETLRKFLYNIEKMENKPKITNIEYRGINNDIIKEIENIINKEFLDSNDHFKRTRYMDHIPTSISEDKTNLVNVYDEGEVDSLHRKNTPPNVSENIILNAPLSKDFYDGNDPKVEKYTGIN